MTIDNIDFQRKWNQTGYTMLGHHIINASIYKLQHIGDELMYIVQYTCKCLYVYHTRWNVEICYTAFLIRDMPMSGSPSCVHICTEFCIMREKGGRHWYYLYLLCIDDWEQSAIFLLYFNRDMCCKIKVLIYMLSWVAVWVSQVIIKWLSQNIQILDHDLG